MSQLTIEPGNARLAVLGYQPEVSRIYWSALPSILPEYGDTLDLSGCEIKAVYADGSETVVTDYCTFTPDTGEAVPNADTLTVTATYTARSGKACQADATLPIVTLDHIKIIIPRTTAELIKEQRREWNGVEPSISGYAQAFGFGGVYVAAYWSRGGEIVRVTKLDTDEVLSSPNVSYLDFPAFMPGPDIKLWRKNSGGGATFERYYTPTEHEEVTYSQVFELGASYTHKGQTYTDTGYLSADYYVRAELNDPPLEYTGTETLTLSVYNGDDIALIYTSAGKQPLSTLFTYLDDNMYQPWLWVNSANVAGIDPPPGGGRYSFKTIEITLANNASGWTRFMGFSGDAWNTIINFSCNNGAVSWTYS